MPRKTESPEHQQIKAEIVSICSNLGLQTIEEYRGNGWIADVLTNSGSEKIAIEVQLSPQSLKKTLERQEKYTRDGVKGCWLFQKPVSKLLRERPDLPLFYVSQIDNIFSVSLSGRKDLSLATFIEDFLTGKIRFCETAKTNREQTVRLIFFEMECWKCKAMNHIYYVEEAFRSTCNAVVEPGVILWGSNRPEHRSEIVEAAQGFVNSEQGKHLCLGEIKSRHSKTVQDSYMSFGCYKCDSIFGDFYVSQAQMKEKMYGDGVAIFEGIINLDNQISLPIPHWCHPGDLEFCE